MSALSVLLRVLLKAAQHPAVRAAAAHAFHAGASELIKHAQKRIAGKGSFK